MYYEQMESPVGRILIAVDHETLRFVLLPDRGRPTRPEPGWVRRATPLLERVRRQLKAYFAGKRYEFDLPLAAEGTPFQRAVWRAMAAVPFGATVSYGELARRVHKPQASRAVGAACGRNPLPIVIPCHRVIGKDGRLVGFGGGLGMKTALLKLEEGYARV
jgi:methylated-DNA-[protein]-cysteine S-methyltransferase